MELWPNPGTEELQSGRAWQEEGKHLGAHSRVWVRPVGWAPEGLKDSGVPELISVTCTLGEVGNLPSFIISREWEAHSAGASMS